jgi:hypothetical protein
MLVVLLATMTVPVAACTWCSADKTGRAVDAAVGGAGGAAPQSFNRGILVLLGGGAAVLAGGAGAVMLAARR